MVFIASSSPAPFMKTEEGYQGGTKSSRNEILLGTFKILATSGDEMINLVHGLEFSTHASVEIDRVQN